MMNIPMELSTGFYENKEAKHQTPTQSKGFLDVVAAELSQSWEGVFALSTSFWEMV